MKLFLIASLIIEILAAQTPEFKWNAEIRTRSNFRRVDSLQNSFQELRMRLDLTITADENTKAFVQIQDSRFYGEAKQLQATSALDVKQAYIQLSNLHDQPLTLKLGRMELSYANQRLVGAVNWHPIGRSFDGSLLNYLSGDYSADVFYFRTDEKSASPFLASNYNYDREDQNFYGTHHILKATDQKVEAYYYNLKYFGSEAALSTIGTFIYKKLDNLSLNLEGDWQFGEDNTGKSIKASLYSADLNYKIDDDLKIGAQLEMQSGDKDDTDNENNNFNPFFGTNHKFNGYMDYFYTKNPGYYSFADRGLNDYQLNFWFKGIKADYHIYQFAEGDKKDIGNELDVTFTHKHNAYVSVELMAATFIFNDDYKNKSERSDYYIYLSFLFKL